MNHERVVPVLWRGEPQLSAGASRCQPSTIACFPVENSDDEKGDKHGTDDDDSVDTTCDRYSYDWMFSLEILRSAVADGCPFCSAVAKSFFMTGKGHITARKALSRGIPYRSKTRFFRLSVSPNPMGNSEEPPLFHRLDVSFGNKVGRADEISFEVCTAEDDLENREVFSERPFLPKRPANTVVDSPAAFVQARNWIEDCCNNHHACGSVGPYESPTRVIDVATYKEGWVPLCVDRVKGYVALSYCWGLKQETILTKAIIASDVLGFPFASLPQTLKDAITVTAALGFKYLWIDALCIIQDSTEDRAEQIDRMAEIYTRANVTIHAASAHSCEEGFLEARNPFAYFTHPFICPGGTQLHVRMRLEADSWDASKEPINKRAWTLQERLLSPRNLIYGSTQLVWQCNTAQYGDGGSQNFFIDPGADVGQFRLSHLDMRSRSSPTSTSVRADLLGLRKDWLRCLGEYTRRAMIDPMDKLPALAAVVWVVLGHLVYLGDRVGTPVSHEYLAGIWKAWLIPDLAWRVPMLTGRYTSRPDHYRAPSWSWASIDGPLQFPNPNFDGPFFCRLTHCDVTSCSGDATQGSLKSLGKVSNGVIVLQAKLKIALRCQAPPCCSNRFQQYRPVGVGYEPEYLVAPSGTGLELEFAGDAYIDLVEGDVPDRRNLPFDEDLLKQFNDQHDMLVASVLCFPLMGQGWPREPIVGLLLKPTNNGQYRRIGLADNLRADFFEDLEEQEVAIV